MAIDGVKIIDSDEAYDIYHYVTEAHRDGVSVEIIIANMLAEESTFCIDSFYTEIYWTSFAYALWKIGHLTEEIKNRALTLIKDGADEEWEKIDPRALAPRQKALDRLAVQLQSENPKPIRVSKAKKKQMPYFDEGDVLTVRFEEKYGAVFVSKIEESPRKLEYHLACTRLLQREKPDMDDFLNSRIACDKRNNSYRLDTDCWFNHRDLGLLLDRLEKIGRVELQDFQLVTLSPAATLEDVYAEITRDLEKFPRILIDTFDIVHHYESCE